MPQGVRLTARQVLFVMEYVADPNKNATQAAIRAGYPNHNARGAASRLMATPSVAQEIERQMRKVVDKLEIDAEMVVAGIVESIEDAKRSGTGAWQAQTVQRGYELLGRYLGIFSDRVEVGLDDKLMAQLAMGRQRAAGLLEEAKEDEVSEGDTGVQPEGNVGGKSGPVN